MKLFREKLAFLQKMIYESDLNIELKHTLIKEAVEQFVQACLHTGTERPEIEQHLNVLCYQDVVIPRTLHEWCFKYLTSSSQQYQQQHSSSSRHPTTGSPTPPKMEAPSLFTKEIIYHSMFLCVTVDTCNDESNYKRSLFRLPTGHSFEQISMSADKSLVERCIIAKKKKVLFVAFRGEPSLCQWPQKYSNFREGMFHIVFRACIIMLHLIHNLTSFEADVAGSIYMYNQDVHLIIPTGCLIPACALFIIISKPCRAGRQ